MKVASHSYAFKGSCVDRFGHDGILLGEAALPEQDITSGRPAIGLVSVPGDNTPPYAASFNNIEVRSIRA